MTNFIRNNTSLPADKTADVIPYDDPPTQWGKADANAVFHALSDIQGVLRGDVFNVKNYGAVGDGVALDHVAINAAISAAAATVNGVYGAFVYLPKGKYLVSEPIILSNGVGLVGDGPPATIIRAAPTFGVPTPFPAIVYNQGQIGNQEYAFLEKLTVDGNNGSVSGSACTVAAVNLVSLFINSYVRDVVILDSPKVGLRIAAAGTPGGSGPILIDNVWVAHSLDHNVLVEEDVSNAGAFAGVIAVNLTSEHQASNKSAIYLKGVGRAEGWRLINTHIEMGGSETGRTGITIDGVSDLRIEGVQLQAGTPANVTAGIAITTAVQNVRLRVDAVTNINVIASVLVDSKNSVTIGAVNLPCYVTPEFSFQGAPRFTPAAGGKSAVFQNSAGADKVWFNASGQLTGSSPNSAAVDLVGAGAGPAGDDRVLTISTNAGGNVFGLVYPNASGGVLELDYLTGGAAIFRFGTDGSVRHRSTKWGFFDTPPVTKPTITGSRGGNAALASLLTAGATLGLWTDSTTA